MVSSIVDIENENRVQGPALNDMLHDRETFGWVGKANGAIVPLFPFPKLVEDRVT
jgi:hypothetical protein